MQHQARRTMRTLTFSLALFLKSVRCGSSRAELKLGQWVCISRDVINDMQHSLKRFATCRTCAEHFTPARVHWSAVSPVKTGQQTGNKGGVSLSETLVRLEPRSAKQDVTHRRTAASVTFVILIILAGFFSQT